MWLFTTIVEKPVYVDTLIDYRNVKIDEFKQLDRVFVTETLKHACQRHPSYPYFREKEKEKPIEWILLWYSSDIFFSKDTVEVKFEKTKLNYMYQNDTLVCYRMPWYKVLTKDWKIIDAYTLKKSHWEFQETFEHMEIMEIKKKNIEASRLAYEKSLQEMSVELEKWKALQTKMYKSIV